MTDTIHFNTGRLYGAKGQRISATLHDDGVITFWDHDRQIDGELNWGRAFSAVSVRAAYDANEYRATKRSWEDGMLRGGVNASYIDKD